MPCSSTFKVEVTPTNAGKTIALNISGRPPTGLKNMGAHTLAWQVYRDAFLLGIDGMTTQEAIYRLVNWFHFRIIQQSLLNINPKSLALDLRKVKIHFSELQAYRQTETCSDNVCRTIESYISSYLSYKNQLPYVVREEGPRAGRGEGSAFRQLRAMELNLNNENTGKFFRKTFHKSMQPTINDSFFENFESVERAEEARKKFDAEMMNQDQYIRSNLTILLGKNRPMAQNILLHFSKLFDEETIQIYLDNMEDDTMRINAIASILIEFRTWITPHYFPNIHCLFFNTNPTRIKLEDGREKEVPYLHYTLSRIIFHKHKASQKEYDFPLSEQLMLVEDATFRALEVEAELYKMYPQWGLSHIASHSGYRSTQKVRYSNGRIEQY